MALNNRAIDLENKYYDQSLQYKTASSSFDLSLSPSKRSTSVDYEKKVSEIEKEFEEIKIDQRDLGNNIILQKIQLEKSRPSSPKMFDATTAQSEEAQLRRLEEMIDGLSENIEILKKQTILQETTKTRDKNQNPLYSSQKIESSPLVRRDIMIFKINHFVYSFHLESWKNLHQDPECEDFPFIQVIQVLAMLEEKNR